MKTKNLLQYAIYLLLSLASVFTAFQRSSAEVNSRPGNGDPVPFAPFDPQCLQDQQDMTWADYHPTPGKDWTDPALAPGRKLRIALVAVDFPDQPFVITLPKKSDLFGNPQIDPIARAQVPRFYADFYNQPGTINHGHTINGYWMEQSRGRVGIPPMDVYGPYRMPKNFFQYGLNEWKQQGGCPGGFKCNGKLEADADALWRADAGPGIKKKYDIVLRIYAGYDETSIWQEFGEMKFQTRDDITAEWGNPNTSKPRWVVTRYVPWTSWKAGQMQWGLSTIRQGENSGTITHEISHYAFKIGDNNNNPYTTPFRRAGSGPWDIMDRGSFNGPGGPHRRWVIPASEGAAMPAGFMLRSRMRFGFIGPETVLQLSRKRLAQTGLVVATITARAIEPGLDSLAGMVINLDGPAPHDRTSPCDPLSDPLCAGTPVFDYYSVEVVQRVGYDSFTPDSGVLIAKNKNKESPSCGYNCFTWVIDAHPEDINMIDFRRPDGTPVMRTIADYRQLNDALFHAGTYSGSACEWEDTANRLHFYIIDRRLDDSGVLIYKVGVRSLDGSGPQKRGVAIGPKASLAMTGLADQVSFTLTNTGSTRTSQGQRHSQDASAYLLQDIYRLRVDIEGQGWTARLYNELSAIPCGKSEAVAVHVSRAADGARSAKLTLTARSESDATQQATVTTELEASGGTP